MLNNLRNRLLRPINSATSVLLGVFTIMWGLWLLGPWSVFNSANLFTTLAFIGSEWIWGAVAIFVGVALVYGAIKPSFKSLICSSAFSSLFWLFISIVLFAADWQNTGGLTYGFIATYSAFIYLNVKVNHDLGHDWSN